MDDKMRGTENKTNWKGDGLNWVDRGIRSGRFFCWKHLLQNILNCYIVLISVAISLLWFFIVVLIVVLRKLTMQSTKIKSLTCKNSMEFLRTAYFLDFNSIFRLFIKWNKLNRISYEFSFDHNVLLWFFFQNGIITQERSFILRHYKLIDVDWIDVISNYLYVMVKYKTRLTIIDWNCMRK